jgi:hypothetical protein
MYSPKFINNLGCNANSNDLFAFLAIVAVCSGTPMANETSTNALVTLTRENLCGPYFNVPVMLGRISFLAAPGAPFYHMLCM